MRARYQPPVAPGNAWGRRTTTSRELLRSVPRAIPKSPLGVRRTLAAGERFLLWGLALARGQDALDPRKSVFAIPAHSWPVGTRKWSWLGTPAACPPRRAPPQYPLPALCLHVRPRSHHLPRPHARPRTRFGAQPPHRGRVRRRGPAAYHAHGLRPSVAHGARARLHPVRGVCAARHPAAHRRCRRLRAGPPRVGGRRRGGARSPLARRLADPRHLRSSRTVHDDAELPGGGGGPARRLPTAPRSLRQGSEPLLQLPRPGAHR